MHNYDRRTTRALLAMEHASPEAMEKYLAAHPKADRRKHKVAPTGNASRGSPSTSAGHKSKTQLSGIFKPSAAAISETLKQHQAKFEALDKEATKAAESFKPKYTPNDYVDDKTDRMTPAFANLPLAEKRLHVAGHKLGEHFESTLSKAESKIHDRYFERWRTTAGSYDREGYGNAADFDHSSQELQGLASSLGVAGKSAPDDEQANVATKGDVDKARRKGAKDPKLQAYAKKLYDYQQAYFKHAGLKELTLYRGVNGATVDGASEGIAVSVDSRELASFTADPNVAKGFGRVIAFKVPVDRVFACSLVRPGIGSETHKGSFGEAEFLIMGASDLVGTAMFDPAARTAAAKKKRIVVPISNENADWLHPPKKRAKRKTTAEHSGQAQRVALRYLLSALLRE